MKWRLRIKQSVKTDELDAAYATDDSSEESMPMKLVEYDEDNFTHATGVSAVTGATGCGGNSDVNRKSRRSKMIEEDEATYATGYTDVTSLKKDDSYVDEEPLEVSLRDNDRFVKDYDDDTMLLEDESKDNPCVGCAAIPMKTVQKEVKGTYKDFAKALYEVSTAWMIREDELDKMTDRIKSAKILPRTKQIVPSVKFLKDDLMVGNKRVNVYV